MTRWYLDPGRARLRSNPKCGVKTNIACLRDHIMWNRNPQRKHKRDGNVHRRLAVIQTVCGLCHVVLGVHGAAAGPILCCRKLQIFIPGPTRISFDGPPRAPKVRPSFSPSLAFLRRVISVPWLMVCLPTQGIERVTLTWFTNFTWFGSTKDKSFLRS